MEKEFMPYEQALALKELGFDEGCFAIYSPGLSEFEISNVNNFRLFSSVFRIDSMQSNLTYVNKKETVKVATPLYQQAFRWFREKYNLDGSITIDVWNTKEANWRITGGIEKVIFVNNPNELYDWESGYFNTYEEAELDCIKKLIEIVKNDNKAN